MFDYREHMMLGRLESANTNAKNHLVFYPRFYKDNDELIPIPGDPQKFRIGISGDGNKGKATEITERLGALALLELNKDTLAESKPVMYHPNEDMSGYLLGDVLYYPDRPFSELKSLSPFDTKNHRQVIAVRDSYNQVAHTRRAVPVEHQPYVDQKELYLEIEGHLYGPFQFTYEDRQLILSAQEKNDYFIEKFLVQDYHPYLIEIKDTARFISRSYLKRISEEQRQPMDWMEAEQLIKKVIIANLHSNTFTRQQKNDIRAFIEENHMGVNEDRLNRASALLDQVQDRETLVSRIISTLWYSDDLADVKAVKDTLLERALSKYELELDPTRDSEKNRDFFRREREKAESNYHQLNAELEAQLQAKQQALSTLETTMDNQRRKLHQEVSSLETKLSELHELKANHELLTDIQTARAAQVQELETAQAINDQLNATLAKFESGTGVVLEKTIDSALFNRVMRGIQGDSLMPKTLATTAFNPELLQAKRSADDIIAQTYDFLVNQAGRVLSRNDVINYLVCVSQGFVTTFAGKPGTGKTSLCNLLAKSLGLSRPDGSARFLEIPVERGWNSHRDLIGYYNPLSGAMEKSNEAVYDAFEALSQERTPVDAPFLMLLDEANLSPLEHYWAPFLRLCDFSERATRHVSLGGPKQLNIPKSLRFLMTVNFDHTTHELSPRFLDRSWVVMLEPAAGSTDIHLDIDLPEPERITTFSSLQDAFTLKAEDYAIDDAGMNALWVRIQRVFQHNAEPIAARSAKMVLCYCTVASGYMDKTATNPYPALDYAISQKVLTTINGSGTTHKQLVNDLEALCTQLPLTLAHLRRMQANAQSYGLYQFFQSGLR